MSKRFRNISFFLSTIASIIQGSCVRKISTFHSTPLNKCFLSRASRSKSVLETNVQWILSRGEDGLYLTKRLGIRLSPIFFVLLTYKSLEATSIYFNLLSFNYELLSFTFIYLLGHVC